MLKNIVQVIADKQNIVYFQLSFIKVQKAIKGTITVTLEETKKIGSISTMINTKQFN